MTSRTEATCDTAVTGRPTAEMAEWAASLDAHDVPAHVRERIALLLLDTVASSLAGRQSREREQLEATARLLAPGQGSTVIAGSPASPIAAAFVNSYQVTAANICDVYVPSLCHVTPEVAPPALVVAENVRTSGRDLITALAAGLETVVRIGIALRYEVFRARGWHSPGVIGPFGGAVAAGKLLALDARQMSRALSLSGSQSAGTFAQWGTPGVKFHQARGSMAGLLAAQLAHHDFPAGDEILAAPDGGLLNVYSDGGDPGALTAELGRHWELEQISVRLWPAASSIQGVLSVVFDLIGRYDVRPADVVSMRVLLSPTTYELHGEMTFENRFRALLSTRYCAAVILHDRACWLDQFTPERIADEEVRAFAEKRIVVEADSGITVNGARLEATLADGRTLIVDRDASHGSPEDPASLGEIQRKFELAAERTLPARQAASVLRQLTDIEEIADVGELVAQLRMPD